MTLRMMAQIYGYPRDREGNLSPRQTEEVEQADEAPDTYRTFWAARGATPEQVERLWSATRHHEAEKAARAIQAGIMDMTGQVIDSVGWEQFSVQQEAAWEAIAKGILTDGQ